MAIREATLADLDEMMRLAEARHQAHEADQPVFWRRAADYEAQQRRWFEKLLADPEVIVLVSGEESSLNGMITGSPMAVPPVYDPGGPTYLVDDFTVSDPALWPTLGKHLLIRLTGQLRTLGAAQVVAICGHHDLAKRKALESCGLAIASEWWTKPLDS